MFEGEKGCIIKVNGNAFLEGLSLMLGSEVYSRVIGFDKDRREYRYVCYSEESDLYESCQKLATYSNKDQERVFVIWPKEYNYEAEFSAEYLDSAVKEIEAEYQQEWDRIKSVIVNDILVYKEAEVSEEEAKEFIKASEDESKLYQPLRVRDQLNDLYFVGQYDNETKVLTVLKYEYRNPVLAMFTRETHYFYSFENIVSNDSADKVFRLFIYAMGDDIEPMDGNIDTIVEYYIEKGENKGLVDDYSERRERKLNETT